MQSSNKNQFEFSLSRNCKVIKTKQDYCSTETQKKNKISFSDLDTAVQKILKDARDLTSFEKVKSNFGQVSYNPETQKINFYSPADLDQIHILGSVDISKSFTEIKNKIPIIYINEDTLEIEQNL